jgi:UDP-3-O-[3-hydroxymyristoyl] glucosamine N-acyltransferase
MNPKIAIIGAGALGIQIANICKRNDIDVIGFFDDTKTVNTSIAGIPILGRIDDIYIYIYAFTHLVIGVGYNHFAFRESLYNKFSKIKPFLTIVDKTAIIDPTARLGEGSIVMPGVILDMNVVVKENVFINIGSVIAHNSTINAHSFIAPSVAIAGFTSIGKKSFI